MKIVLASSNKHKVQEINDIVKSKYGKECNIEFVLPPEGFDPIEDGKTFEDNSKIKAIEAWKLTKNWALADDSGLCIKALDGAPGLFSARYAETPQKRIERVLAEMQGKTDRAAEFVCAMTLINPQGDVAFTCKGLCKGSITEKQAGTNGFGYDPIFLVEGRTTTMAELSEEEKNQISHRSQALNQVLDYLQVQGK